MNRFLIAFVAIAALGAQNAFAQCCATASDGSSCKAVTPVLTTEVLSGCIDDDMGTCGGGTFDPKTPTALTGCVCVAGTCNVGPTQACTDAAAAACCASGQGNNCPAPPYSVIANQHLTVTGLGPQGDQSCDVSYDLFVPNSASAANQVPAVLMGLTFPAGGNRSETGSGVQHQGSDVRQPRLRGPLLLCAR
jgi:hypothetical protein